MMKKSRRSLSKHQPYHIVMLIEAWFPYGKKRAGIFGGGQVHVKEIRKHLQQDFGAKVELFFPKNPHIIYRFFWTFFVIFKLLHYARSHRVDLIHSHGYNSGIAAKIVASILNLPVIHTVHGSSLLDQGSKNPKARLERFLLTKIKYTAQITVSSNFLKHANVNENIFVIPNGVDVADFDAVKVKKNDRPTLIWVGRDDPVKGVEILKKAILKVRRKLPNLKTELVTGGRLTGVSLIRAYKRSHVFVLPSLAEGQPITLLEAWAAKLPVVVTKVGENPSMVVDGVNGLLVDPGNTKQLAEAILRLLRARTADKKMGEEGYALVKRQYSWDIVAKETFQVYHHVITRFEKSRKLRHTQTIKKQLMSPAG